MEGHIVKGLEWHLCISEALAKCISGEKYQKGNKQCSSGKFHKIEKKRGGDRNSIFTSILNPRKEKLIWEKRMMRMCRDMKRQEDYEILDHLLEKLQLSCERVSYTCPASRHVVLCFLCSRQIKSSQPSTSWNNCFLQPQDIGPRYSGENLVSSFIWSQYSMLRLILQD